MIKKYIIELDDTADFIQVYGRYVLKGIMQTYKNKHEVRYLKELDADYIKEHFKDLLDEAYQNGYKARDSVIRIGDEVIILDKKGNREIGTLPLVITSETGNYYQGIDKDGIPYSVSKNSVRKTGRYFETYHKLMEEMKK